MGKLETLRSELQKARKILHDKGKEYIPGKSKLMDIKPFEIAYQDVIERIWPDKVWWEVTKYWDIFDAMMSGLSDEEVIDAICSHVDDEFLNEGTSTINDCQVEYGHTLKEYLEKYGDLYEDGLLDSYLKEDFERGIQTRNLVHWYMEDFDGNWTYFETPVENTTQLNESQELKEGTSNFGFLDNFPLLVFYTMDEFLWNMHHDSNYPQEEDFETDLGDGDYHIDYDAFEDAKDKFEEEYWDANKVCVLDEDDQERLEEKLYDFNEESKRMAWEADLDENGYQKYDNNLNLEDVQLNIEPGYYSGAYIDCANEKYLDYLDDDFREKQIERFNEFFKAIKEEFGLTELGVSYHASNGETGYQIIKDETDDSLKEKKSKKKYKVNFTGDPEKNVAFFNHAMGSDVVSNVSLGEDKVDEGYLGQDVNDFLNIIAEPDLIETLVIADIDSDDYVEAFKGNEADLSEELREAEYADFDIGGGKLVVNVSSNEDETGDVYYTTLGELLEDYNGDEVEVQEEGEVLFSGYKDEVDDELLLKTFVYIDTPEYLCINAHCEGIDYEEVEQEVDDEFDDDHLVFETSQEAYDYLKELAQDEDYEFYDIVEDTYEYPNGLCLIHYADKDQEEEIDHICVEIRDGVEEDLNESFEEIYIKYWEDEELRDQGISEIYRDNFATREEAIEVARKLIDRDGFASVEVMVSPSGELESEDDFVVWGYDGVDTWGIGKEESLEEEILYKLIRTSKDIDGNVVSEEVVMEGSKDECMKEKAGLESSSPEDAHGNANHYRVVAKN